MKENNEKRSELRNTITAMKNTLESTVDEMIQKTIQPTWIQSSKNHQLHQQKEKKIDEDSLKNIWEKIKHTNI